MREIEFTASTGPTIGVEWEFGLVDAQSRDLANRATPVLEALRDCGEPTIIKRVHQELLRNTVEVVTGICRNTAEASDDLKATLEAVGKTTRDFDVRLFGAGTHPFAEWSDQILTDSPRYAELIERTQWWGRQMLIWGVHVHVGITDKAKVMPIVSALCSYYPHLLALSSSSPMWEQHDTGYASNRAMMFQQLPTAGLPFQFATWAEFESFIDDQKTTGIIDHLNEIRWDIRPSPHLGTIEIRVCDSMSTFVELEAVVALIHCLVVRLSERLDAGEILDVLPPWSVQENKWRAARYGLDAIVITDSHNHEQLVTDHLGAVLDDLAPTAKVLGCSPELAGVERIWQRGASYQRQRTAAQNSDNNLIDVVDSVVNALEI